KDMGYAKTDPGPSPPKDTGYAKTEPGSPPSPLHSGSGTGTIAVPPSRRDGQPVEIKQAFDVMRKNGAMIRSSGSHSYHRKIWQEYLGNTSDQPLAFKYSGRIQFDVDKLEASQHQQWLALDKEKNPGRY